MRLKGKELEERNAKIIQMHIAGVANKEIAEQLNVNPSTVSSVIRKSRQEQKQKNDNKGNRSSSDNMALNADEESRYMETLYAYTKSFININECAIDGMEIDKLKEKVARTKDAFKILSGIEIEPIKVEQNITDSDNIQVTVSDKKILYNGWLRCPHCGKKMHKVSKTTRVNDFPLWCKQCHKTTIINMG